MARTQEIPRLFEQAMELLVRAISADGRSGPAAPIGRFLQLCGQGRFDPALGRREQGRSLLGWALCYGLPEAALALLEAGADPRSSTDGPALHPSIGHPDWDWLVHAADRARRPSALRMASAPASVDWGPCLERMARGGSRFDERDEPSGGADRLAAEAGEPIVRALERARAAAQAERISEAGAIRGSSATAEGSARIRIL